MHSINSTLSSATAFAPATCANVAVGFDILGFAFEGVGDTVTLTRRHDQQFIIESIESVEPLPLESDKNTASVVIKKLCQDLQLDLGFTIKIKKGIPLSSGMGGSAASAVAALVACNAFITPALSRHQLAEYALLGEAVAAGQAHPDNIVPCIWGGLTLINSVNPIQVISLPIPEVFCVLVHPHLHVSTAEARKVLQNTVSLKSAIQQAGNVAAFISALYTNNIDLLQHSLHDVWIEPQRAHFVPGFYDVKKAALQAGALGMSFSGSGPTLFAFARSRNDADLIAQAMQSTLKNNNIDSDRWTSKISDKAAHLI